ncbi:uroporphyrinogen-III C-methyltransferase [Rouxiella sp. Mn2063]|uniref:uroporphyrinogen-III C-methyltransferase n=1 Tax=Rouxiella sp. Mn2063 TaxID=3395262 RepID=UPI003BE203B0
MQNILSVLSQHEPLQHAACTQPVTAGEVWLVGAGPGDVELLTIKALRAISCADVVVFDRLVSAPVMALIPETALQIDAGKSTRHHTLDQGEINQLLVDMARLGHKVVRLKGGDPFIFGRGGEEMQHCQQAGIICHVVPGITAAVGCAAASGIPLTHRDIAQSVRFVTGHTRQGEPDIYWQGLAETKQTLVFYMGLTHNATLSQKLIHHGLAASTPVAIIERGTQPTQRVLIGTLSTLAMLAERHAVASPALLIIGHVVGLHSSMQNHIQQAG